MPQDTSVSDFLIASDQITNIVCIVQDSVSKLVKSEVLVLGPLKPNSVNNLQIDY